MMTVEDMIQSFDVIFRTRLFSSGWMFSQLWAEFPVPWKGGYQRKKFCLKVAKEGTVVIVLSTVSMRFCGSHQPSLTFPDQSAGLSWP